MAKRYSSLENALRLMELFTVEESEWTVKDIADQLGIANSTAHRLLSTLEDEGFIVKDFITNNYRLGVSILSLTSVITSNKEIIKLSNSVLQKLSERFKETAQIGVIQGTNVYYINRADYEHPVFGVQTYYAERKADFHCTAAGKILAAQLPDKEILHIVSKNLPSYTADTITFATELQNEIQMAANQGYATSFNEHHEEVSSVAVPIKDSNNNVMAALELIGPSENINDHTVKEIVSLLHQASSSITERLS